ncbi:GntR family transcriptional regulator [Enterocloster lavalensis]|uniref:GntR family transcriptional regulator n=1 Tax=Enterocloster lavalensis TaxID=460384 RepID=UPI0034A5396F
MAKLGNKRVITVAEYAYNTIQEMILSGELSPGERINLDALTELMEASRIPVKQALDKLCAEGLVLEVPRKGMSVMPVSVEDLNSIFEMRCSMEPMAYIKAFQHVSDEDIRALHALLDTQDKETVDVNLVMAQNKEFHSVLYALSKDEGLIKNINQLWILSNRYRRLYYKETTYNSRIVKEHYELVDYLEKGKKQEGVDMLIEHTRRSQEIILKMFGEEIQPLPFKLTVV